MSDETPPPIDPWYAYARCSSPDGKFTAVIEEAFEIAMGAPTSGTLKISNGQEIEHCNPSFIWSDDSRYLAVPQWTPSRMQHLLIIDVVDERTFVAAGEYRVLELKEFSGGVVRGTDSPVHKPRDVEVDISCIVEAT